MFIKDRDSRPIVAYNASAYSTSDLFSRLQFFPLEIDKLIPKFNCLDLLGCRVMNSRPTHSIIELEKKTKKANAVFNCLTSKHRIKKGLCVHVALAIMDLIDVKTHNHELVPHKGFKLINGTHDPNYVMMIRDSDVFVVTYPKSGERGKKV